MANGGGGRLIDVTVVLLGDGLSSTSVMPAEIFHSAGALWEALHGRPATARFRVRTASLDGRAVRNPFGVDVTPGCAIAEIDRTDIVVVPTSGLDFEPKLVENSALLPWLRRHHAAGAYLVGACMGSAYLAEAGLLDGRIATTHWALAATFSKRYPNVRWQPDRFVTEDNRLLCSGGVYGAVDVSLYLVEKLCGHEVALQCARSLLLPMPRLHQNSYAMLPVAQEHDDVAVRAAEAHLAAHFREDVAAATLAGKAGLAPRTFVRRFKAATGRSPAAYAQALRVEAAKAMLEREATPVQSVSAEIGYEDAAFFRQIFKRETGMTPAEYRAHFAPLAVRGHPVLEGA